MKRRIITITRVKKFKIEKLLFWGQIRGHKIKKRFKKALETPI